MIDSKRATDIPLWFTGSGPESDIVISTRVRLARCLANHHFPSNASLQQRRAAFDEVASAAAGVSRFARSELLNFIDCNRLEQELLVENRDASPDLLESEGDRGVILSEDCPVRMMVNEEDHVRLQCLSSGYQAEKAWRSVSELDDALGTRLVFAFDHRRGFLTSCPTNSGTGLRVSFLLHLPGLILTKAIDQVLLGASQMGISTRGFFGEYSSVVGSFFQLSNQAAMGCTEEEFLGTTQAAIGEVVRCERDARLRLLKEARDELTDKAYRAYGLLLYARSLGMDELLNLTSAVRLGVESGIFNMVSVEALNRMILLCMPAHLQVFLGREIEGSQLDRSRAEQVRATLEGKQTIR